MKSASVFTVFLLFYHSNCTKLPSSFQKCNRKDENFKQCLTKAVESAVKQLQGPIKEVGLVGLEPLDIPSMVIGAGSGAVGLSQNYKDIKVTGHHQLTCSEVDMDFDTKTLKISCFIPELKLEFQYNVNGKILVLPVYGTGPGSITLVDLSFVLSMKMAEYQKKGGEHWKVVDRNLVMDPKLIVFNFENLFDGDKALGDNINRVINENWEDIFADVKSSYENAFGQIYSSIFDSLLSRVSVAELFGDD